MSVNLYKDNKLIPIAGAGSGGGSANIDFNNEQFIIENNKLNLSTNITSKLEKIDESADWLKVKNLVKKVILGNIDSDTGKWEGFYMTYASLSEFAEVEPDENYICSLNGVEKEIKWFFYDADKNYLGNSVTVTSSKATIPSNAKYIKFHCANCTDLNGWQIEKGESISEYHPYNESNAELTQRLDEIEPMVTSSNIWDETWEQGGYDGYTGVKASVAGKIRSANRIKVKPNTTYYVVAPDGLNLYFYGASGNFITAIEAQKNTTFDTHAENEDVYYIAFSTFGSDKTSYSNNIAIIEGTSGSYEPHAKSNVELTKELTIETATITSIPSNLGFESGLVTRHGSVYHITARFKPSSQIRAYTPLMNINIGTGLKGNFVMFNDSGYVCAGYIENNQIKNRGLLDTTQAYNIDAIVIAR